LSKHLLLILYLLALIGKLVDLISLPFKPIFQVLHLLIHLKLIDLELELLPLSLLVLPLADILVLLDLVVDLNLKVLLVILEG
jgi:hypothetical protein